MYVSSVKIENLRCFERETVEFVHPDAGLERRFSNVTLLVGDNGVGKTTVLRAVSLVVLNIALQQAGYVPYSMVRRTTIGRGSRAALRAVISCHPQDLNGTLFQQSMFGHDDWESSLSIARKGDVEYVVDDIAPELVPYERELYSDRSPGVLVLGYGATRRVDPASEFSPRLRRKTRTLRYDRVASLFEEQVALLSWASWFPEVRHEKPHIYARVCELLDQLIPQDTRFTGELDGELPEASLSER